MRGDAGCPKILQHIEFAANAIEVEEFCKPTQLVFLMHAAHAQGAFVEWGKAKCIGLAVSHQ